jgi:UDP-N-acetylmuramate: L-alanyl-gamma-D-glutamyl-meso-diaminopimelate ligase
VTSRKSETMLKKGAHVYFIGIGGIAMSQAALLVQEMGYRVRGSDPAVHPPTDQLLQEGNITVEKGYTVSHLDPPPDLVVIGNAVSRGNPEVEAVLDKAIPYLSLPALIRDCLLEGRRSAVVAGTHGKTTTTALLAWLLFAGGMDPSFLVGGVPLNFGRGYHSGKGEWVVIEGDEYDSAFFDKQPKFLHYLPRIVILNSIEYDHADIYHDLEEVKRAFCQLIAIIPSEGILIARNDDTVVRDVIAGARCRVETFGTAGRWSPHGVRVTPQGTAFSLRREDEKVAELEVPLWGEHNVTNTVGAAVAATLIGLPLARIRDALRTFQGVKRRMELIGETRGITVIDDFAHHPTAVRETLRGMRVRSPQGRLWAIFEPRSQTMRRKVFEEGLAAALGEADRVVIGKVFSAPSQGEVLDPFSVVQAIRKVKGTSAAVYKEEPDQIIAHCVAEAAPGDIIIVMSSGHFEGLPKRIFKALKDRS